MIYFDTSYIVRLYYEDPGWRQVRELAASDHVACCLLGRAEAQAALHRKLREGALRRAELRVLLGQFRRECDLAAFHWLPFSVAVVGRMDRIYENLSESVHLRAADAVHLSCAAENGFKEIYSNDRQLLSAAPHFGLRGLDVI